MEREQLLREPLWEAHSANQMLSCINVLQQNYLKPKGPNKDLLWCKKATFVEGGQTETRLA